MNRGNRYSRERGRGRQSWRAVTAHTSPDNQTPIWADVSSSAHLSSTSDGNSHRSWQAVQQKSGGSVSHNMTPTGGQGQIQDGNTSRGRVLSTSGGRSHSSRHAVQHNSGGHASLNVTPTGCQEFRADGSSISSTGHGNLHSSRQAVGHNSGGSVYKAVPLADRQGRGWSAYGSGSSSHRDTKLSASSSSINTSGSSQGKSLWSPSGQLSSDEKDGHKPAGDSFKGWGSPVDLNLSFMESLDHPSDVSRPSDKDLLEISRSDAKVPESTGNSQGNGNSECSIPVFDICPPRETNSVALKPSLMSINKEKRREKERSAGGPKGDILRSGMVLLKSYLSSSEQASILRICRHHGMGPAGFYQPQFSEGGKMHLKLMCFGQFWDPESSKYGEVRPMDRAKPPEVPQELLQLVDRAVKDSQSFISENSGVINVEDILPSVKPDICLVNYYSKTGCLGLHQDKDEGRLSLGKGIPIVSFSIGDSAEFLYSDQRDADNAKKVILESGDVLIFGGKSRHIFHGVRAILPDTAPKWLLEKTNFRPGRLNLTFRQHL